MSPSSRRGFTWGELIVVLVILVGLIALLLPATRSARGPARRVQCKNNLKQIGLALHNYHDVYGCFPPAITYGPDGKPWHSWRVLIMPQIVSSRFYQEYSFDEPWNGPRNRKLADRYDHAPEPYRCPSDDDIRPTNTSYLAVIGEGTMWPPDGVATLADAADGADRTLHVVEVSNSGVHWMEPADLRLDAMQFAVGPKPQPGIRGSHGGTDRWFRADDPWVAQAEFVDGSVRALSEETPPETVRSLLLRDDGGPAAAEY